MDAHCRPRVALDEDLEEHAGEVEEWLIVWQATSTGGESWVRGMVR
jgi:hypothetical protein